MIFTFLFETISSFPSLTWFIFETAGPSNRAVEGVFLRPLALWDCGFESHRGHGCLLWVLCVLSGRGLCDELITRPEESYWLQCVVVCDVETSWMRRPWPTAGAILPKTKNIYIIFKKLTFWKSAAVRKMTTCCLGESFSSVSVLSYSCA